MNSDNTQLTKKNKQKNQIFDFYSSQKIKLSIFPVDICFFLDKTI